MLENRKVSPEKLKLVSRYMTPYAALLVLFGVYFGSLPKIDQWLTLAILAISLAVNLSSMVGLEKVPAQASLIRDVRVGINIVANFWLIYILMPYWPDIWMLLLLVVIALAVYDTPETTVFFSYAFACLLLVVAYLRSVPPGIQLGTILMDAATLVFIGIFISQLINAIQPLSAGDEKALPEKLRVVSFSMTPYAVALVVMGLIFGSPNTTEARLSIGLLIVSIVVNLGAILGLEKIPVRSSLIRDVRVGLNVVCNFWLIYILLPYWPDIWMLILLMVIALGVYDSRKATLFYCCAFSGLLIFIAYLKKMLNGVHLGETLIHVGTLLFIGPFINRLVGVLQGEGKPGSTP